MDALPPFHAVALSTWTLDSAALAEPASARLVELALHACVVQEQRRLDAWVVLPGALHVLAPASGVADVAPWQLLFGRVKALSARWWNRTHGGDGPLWREGFRIRWIADVETSERLRERLHAAPVEARLVSAPWDWPWSSWHATAGRPPHPELGLPAR